MKKTFFFADPEKIKQRIEEDKKRHPQYEPFLIFGNNCCPSNGFLADRPGETPPIAEPLKQLKFKEGFPFFLLRISRSTPLGSGDLFQEILKGIRAANPKMTEQIPLVEKWLAGEGRNLDHWLTLLFQEDGRPFIRAAASCGLDPEILLFLFLAGWKPFLKSQAQVLARDPELDWAAWSKSYCPVCGGMPLLAYRRKGESVSGPVPSVNFPGPCPGSFALTAKIRISRNSAIFFRKKKKAFVWRSARPAGII